MRGPAYLEWVRSLRAAGHEIALHNVSSATATRERTRLGFERFRELFGEDPRSLANHTGNQEAIYHGEARVTGLRRGIYNVLTAVAAATRSWDTCPRARSSGATSVATT